MSSIPKSEIYKTINNLYNNDKREIRIIVLPRLKRKFDECCKYVD